MALTGILLETKRFAVHDGPGIRTAFFTKGCPLKCLWCHNPESSSGAPQMGFYSDLCCSCGTCAAVCPESAHHVVPEKHSFDLSRCRSCGKCVEECPREAMKLYGKKVTLDEALVIAIEDRDFFQESGGGVTISGGEPLVQKEFTLALLREVKKAGIHTCLDTCAFVPQKAFEEALEVTDMFLVDFKHAVSYEHKKLTGLGNELVCQNLQWLSDRGARIEIRIPLIPGCNDSYENMEKTAGFLSKLCIESVRLLPYHSLARSKYRAINMPDTMPDVPTPEYDQLTEFAGILQKSGLTVKAI
jgi:pyruvate formate lyase activating enzyme